MAALQYFLPGVQRGQFVGRWRATIEAFDLEDVLADITDPVSECFIQDMRGKSPSGAAGCLLCALPRLEDAPARLGYFPDAQEWRQVDPRVWIGTDIHERVSPGELARDRSIAGDAVTLGDGQTWLIPVVRDPLGDYGAENARESSLPSKAVKRGGKWWVGVDERYRGLWEDAGRLFDALRFAPASEWPIDDLMDYCLRVLSVNYRVGAWEQERLGLLTDRNWQEIVAVSFGQRLEDDLKKSAAV